MSVSTYTPPLRPTPRRPRRWETVDHAHEGVDRRVVDPRNGDQILALQVDDVLKVRQPAAESAATACGVTPGLAEREVLAAGRSPPRLRPSTLRSARACGREDLLLLGQVLLLADEIDLVAGELRREPHVLTGTPDRQRADPRRRLPSHASPACARPRPRSSDPSVPFSTSTLSADSDSARGSSLPAQGLPAAPCDGPGRPWKPQAPRPSPRDSPAGTAPEQRSDRGSAASTGTASRAGSENNPPSSTPHPQGG